jgi:ribonuclease Z
VSMYALLLACRQSTLKSKISQSLDIDRFFEIRLYYYIIVHIIAFTMSGRHHCLTTAPSATHATCVGTSLPRFWKGIVLCNANNLRKKYNRSFTGILCVSGLPDDSEDVGVSVSAPVASVLQENESYTYKQLRMLSVDQLKSELKSRNLPYLGYKSQLAGRLYQALLDEGRGLVGEEASRVDALLSGQEITQDSDDSDGDYFEAAMEAEPLFKVQKGRMSGILLEEDSESVMSNKTGMQVAFLSTLTAENRIKIATGLAIRTLQSVWLFECGEDTQRSLIGHTLVDWKRIDRIFISSMDPESVLGLPGMLCTISASRSKGHEAADIPVHVFGPPGLVSFVSSMLAVSRTYLEMPVILHELTPGHVEPDTIGVPVEVLKRSRLYAMKLPPDQLNPDGYYDGALSPMLNRHTKKRSGGGNDLRAGTLPQHLPPPGDATRTDVSVADMKWTIRADSEWIVTAAPLKNDKPCLGFKAIESDRSGRLFPALAQALGVFDSKQYSDLKAGKTVLTENGTEVHPDECVGPTRDGRTVGIVPPCIDSALYARKMGPLDVLVHSMTTRSKDGSLVSLAKVAGESAHNLGAKELILWQSQTSFLDEAASRDDKFPETVIKDAAASYKDGEHISLAGTYAAHQWERDSQEDQFFPRHVPEHLRHLLH